ncbi:hypothetical protein IQ250_08920 [Pseudanabaenaceae cyanobacterium LEGE 13415]|nr:hypothetical protein [Pseudanabaenaceae cyanobacterium LEGE 13415]
MLNYGTGNCALVMWHSVLKPSELKKSRSTIQPQKKLRVSWKLQTQDWTGGFIPKDKSISDSSLIAQAYTSGQARSGIEAIDLGWTSIQCQIEAMPVHWGI